MTKLGTDFGFTPELLGLTDIKIESIHLGHDNSLTIKVTSTKEQISYRKCGNPIDAYGRGRTLRLRHLPILDREVFIEITPP